MMCPCNSLPGPSKTWNAPDERDLQIGSVVSAAALAAIEQGLTWPWFHFGLTEFLRQSVACMQSYSFFGACAVAAGLARPKGKLQF